MGEKRYIFIASMDVAPDKEKLFNEVYDTEHIPYLLEVPGVISVIRAINQDVEMMIGGELKTIKNENEPRYVAVYELESPDVLKSEQWAAAVERGRWPSEVRPHTYNRRHALQQVIKS